LFGKDCMKISIEDRRRLSAMRVLHNSKTSHTGTTSTVSLCDMHICQLYIHVVGQYEGHK